MKKIFLLFVTILLVTGCGSSKEKKFTYKVKDLISYDYISGSTVSFTIESEEEYKEDLGLIFSDIFLDDLGYDEKYFKNNKLVAIYINTGSGEDYYEIKDVKLAANNLIVSIEQTKFSPPELMALMHFYIEIDKDVEFEKVLVKK